jgi:hypothetical protein
MMARSRLIIESNTLIQLELPIRALTANQERKEQRPINRARSRIPKWYRKPPRSPHTFGLEASRQIMNFISLEMSVSNGPRNDMPLCVSQRRPN